MALFQQKIIDLTRFVHIYLNETSRIGQSKISELGVLRNQLVFVV